MSVTLTSGVDMPLVGFGTFKIKGKELMYQVLNAALAAGYRSIDTAAVYRNESDIGECLRELLPKHGLTRRDIFITSKLGPKDQGEGRCRARCLESLHNLQCDYLDMYLIHWPGTQGMKPTDPRQRGLRVESWKDMIAMKTEGKLKAIGVSNFLPHHIDDLIQNTASKPDVLQTEIHPHLIQRELVKYCNRQGIHCQAYSSLGSTTHHNTLLTDPVVGRIATERGVSWARILLRWAVQQGIGDIMTGATCGAADDHSSGTPDLAFGFCEGVIPKSTNPDHIRDNFDIFSFCLSESEMSDLDQLDRHTHICWDPTHVV